MISSAQDVMRVAEERGFKVCVKPGPPPMPYLRGDPEKATTALLDALKAWRLEIIEVLQQSEVKP